jgi:hypothetical protein
MKHLRRGVLSTHSWLAFVSTASLQSHLRPVNMKYALGAALVLQSTLALGELLPVHLKAPTTGHFRDIVRNDTYDFGV